MNSKKDSVTGSKRNANTDGWGNKLVYSLNRRAVSGAMGAPVGAHAVAREFTNPTSIAVARAVGQSIATAHMADHSLGVAIYALKAIINAVKSIETERKWQNEQLPSEIKEIVLATRTIKEKA